MRHGNIVRRVGGNCSVLARIWRQKRLVRDVRPATELKYKNRKISLPVFSLYRPVITLGFETLRGILMICCAPNRGNDGSPKYPCSSGNRTVFCSGRVEPVELLPKSRLSMVCKVNGRNQLFLINLSTMKSQSATGSSRSNTGTPAGAPVGFPAMATRLSSAVQSSSL